MRLFITKALKRQIVKVGLTKNIKPSFLTSKSCKSSFTIKY